MIIEGRQLKSLPLKCRLKRATLSFNMLPNLQFVLRLKLQQDPKPGGRHLLWGITLQLVRQVHPFRKPQEREEADGQRVWGHFGDL